MAYTAVTVNAADANGATGVDLDAAFAAITVENKVMNRGGNTLIFFRTLAGETVDVEIDSVADPYGRLGNLGPTSLSASKLYVFGPFSPRLFNQSGVDDGYIYLAYTNVVDTPEIAAMSV